MDALFGIVLWLGAAVMIVACRKWFGSRSHPDSGSWVSMSAALAVTVLICLGGAELIMFVLSGQGSLRWAYLIGAFAAAIAIPMLATRLSRPHGPDGQLHA